MGFHRLRRPSGWVRAHLAGLLQETLVDIANALPLVEIRFSHHHLGYIVMSWNHPSRSIGFSVVAAIAFLVSACAPPPSTLSEADLAAIRAAGDEFEEAGANNDWAAVAALYTEDAVLMPPNAPAVTGRASIQEVFGQFPTLTSMELTVDDIQGAGDVAVVRGSYSLAMDIEGQMVEDSGKYLEVRRKQADGSWPITIDTWNSDIPVPIPGDGDDEM